MRQVEFCAIPCLQIGFWHEKAALWCLRGSVGVWLCDECGCGDVVVWGYVTYCPASVASAHLFCCRRETVRLLKISFVACVLGIKIDFGRGLEVLLAHGKPRRFAVLVVICRPVGALVLGCDGLDAPAHAETVGVDHLIANAKFVLHSIILLRQCYVDLGNHRQCAVDHIVYAVWPCCGWSKNGDCLHG